MGLNDKALQAVVIADDVSYSVAEHDYLVAMRRLRALADAFTDLAADVAQAAYDDGATKKAIAEALGVPPSTFRGMRRRESA